MAKATQEKLEKSTATICKAVFEATEVSTPTCFVIIPYEYGTAADKGSVAAEYAEKMARLDDLTSMAARPLDSLKSAVSSVDAADKTMDKLNCFVEKVSAVASNPLQAAQVLVQEELKKIADSYTGKTLYFYLIDEISGEPIESDVYPVEITTSSALVQEHLPIMRMGLKAVGSMNGVAGLTKMFGVPYPSSGISRLLEKAGGMVDKLDKESSVA